MLTSFALRILAGDVAPPPPWGAWWLPSRADVDGGAVPPGGTRGGAVGDVDAEGPGTDLEVGTDANGTVAPPPDGAARTRVVAATAPSPRRDPGDPERH